MTVNKPIHTLQQSMIVNTTINLTAIKAIYVPDKLTIVIITSKTVVKSIV